MSPPKLVASWRVALWGSILQVGASVGLVALLGGVLGRPLPECVLLGFVVSLSSTAVVAKLLHEGGELGSRAGRHVLAILLAQDVAIIPMLVGVQLLAGGEVPTQQLVLQVGGSAAFLAVLAWALTRRQLRLPLGHLLRKDPELQVFAALILCFGLALVSALVGLSAALGAFLAGVILSSARETDWVRQRLDSFHVVFLGLFFVSIGMLIDLSFLAHNLPRVALLVAAILVTNTFINAGILRLLGDSRRSSLYAGALLAQVGELSFLLVTAGYGGGLIGESGYQTALATIALSLLLSPAWIALFRRLTNAGQEEEASEPAPAAAIGRPLVPALAPLLAPGLARDEEAGASQATAVAPPPSARPIRVAPWTALAPRRRARGRGLAVPRPAVRRVRRRRAQGGDTPAAAAPVGTAHQVEARAPPAAGTSRSPDRSPGRS